MNLYKVTDQSPDAKPNPVVFVKAENAGNATKRAIAAMETVSRPRERVVVEYVCDLDQCYSISGG